MRCLGWAAPCRAVPSVLLLALMAATCAPCLTACDTCATQRVEIDPSEAATLGAGVPADLEVRAQGELTWMDRDGGRHAERVDLKIWMQGSTAVACDVSSLGSRVAWVGGAKAEWWLFERREAGMVLTRGVREELDPGSPLAVFLRPGLVRLVLALTAPDDVPTIDDATRITWIGPMRDGRPSGLDLHRPGTDVTWHVTWWGDRPIGSAGSGQGSMPSTITIDGPAGGCTLWVSQVQPSAGKPAYFDLAALRAALRPVEGQPVP